MKRALAVGVLVCAGLLVLLGFQAPQKKELTVANVMAEGLMGRGPENVKWSPDGTKISFVQRDEPGERRELWYIDVATGKRAVLVASDKLQALAPPLSSIKNERERTAMQRYGVSAYHWAPDSKHLLFDARGQLWLYTLDTGTAVQLTTSADSNKDPKFSPDGKKIAYIRKHNLFVQPASGGEQVQLTKDTDEDLLNGDVDWVYEEELAVRSNYFWSPDGKQIAFVQMNEKPVPTYPITDWMTLHPKVDPEKYPKAGDSNPGVKLAVIGAGGGKIHWITPTQETDIYIPRFGWLRDGIVWVEVMNRAQNKLDLYFVEAGGGRSRLVMTETSDTWIEESYEPPHFLKSGDRYIWSSWRDGHTHLYLYSFDQRNPLASEAKLERELTKGDYETFGIQGVDETSGTVYFTSNEGDPRQRQLYALKLDGSAPQQITRAEGTHAVSFPENAKTYYLDSYSALMIPPKLSLCQVGASCTEVWASSDPAKQFDLIQPKFLSLKAADGTTTLYGLLLMPTNVSAKVPLIMNPYGGPSGQSVRNGWNAISLYDQVFAHEGFAVLKVDNRGMAGRGKIFAAAVSHNLGAVELQDQLAALNQVLQQFPELDRNRLGWWGWSYGGFMTCYALTHSDLFKAGVCGAPVTDWRFYDSIYTERYMGLPKDNAEGYRNSAPVNAAANAHGRVLLMHGTSDDNVHFQNTIQMVQSLMMAEKEYDLQLYPGKTHGVSGTKERIQLYTRILEHFKTYVMGINQ